MDRQQMASNLLGKIIDLMRNEGWEVESPYDVENFFDDYGSHSAMFATGRFDDIRDHDDLDEDEEDTEYWSEARIREWTVGMYKPFAWESTDGPTT